MNSDQETEAKLVSSFILTYTALRRGVEHAQVTQVEAIALLDQLAMCFRDYITLQRAGVQTQIAIEKVKNVTK